MAHRPYSASLTAPRAVAADSAGNVFIVDAGNQRVRRVSPDGIITTVAGGGSAVLGDGGPATKGQLNYPQSIAIDSRGNLLVGELGRVRKVSADGTITTVAGGGSNTPGDGGSATSARLSTVVHVAVDGAGNLFLADQSYDEETDEYGYSLRKVSPDGLISTLPSDPVLLLRGHDRGCRGEPVRCGRTKRLEDCAERRPDRRGRQRKLRRSIRRRPACQPGTIERANGRDA